MSSLHVASEVAPLEAVLVHSPGRELTAVTPGSREHYLYDDIIDLAIAQREHRRLVAVLERFAEVLEVRQCLSEVLEDDASRQWLLSRLRNVVPSDSLTQRLQDLPTDDLVALLIEGVEAEPGPISKALNEPGFLIPPVPNLFFPRDVGIVVNRHAIVGSMRYGVRWTEELLITALFRHHPAFANDGILYDGSEERRHDYTLEGGDVHPVRSDLLVLGFSERSSPAALDHLCDLVFSGDSIEDVLVVVLPTTPTAIHLDMIFTQIDEATCVVYPPFFVGPERLPVLHRHKGSAEVRQMPDFFSALDELGMPLEPVFCGGNHRIGQDREQWASACNFFTVRPGVSLSYARNTRTLSALQARGFRVVSAVDFLTGEDAVEEGDRVIITLEATELVRGGGGPRCMTVPLVRAS